MASQRICSIPECGKPHLAKGLCSLHYERALDDPCTVLGCGNRGKLKRGLCHKHYSRLRHHGDPLYLVPKEMRKKNGPKGPRFQVDGDWLRNEYEIKRRRNDDICHEIGCSAPTLLRILAFNAIQARDDRAGAVHDTRRVKFDLVEATRLYVEEKKNCNDIGELYGVNGCSVRRRLRESGVRIRHHNDTKRGKPNHRHVYLDSKHVIAIVGISAVFLILAVRLDMMRVEIAPTRIAAALTHKPVATIMRIGEFR